MTKDRDWQDQWRALIGGEQEIPDPAAAWFYYMGIEALKERAGVVIDGGQTLWSFQGAVFLAEHMPEEFQRWRALRRMGVE